jgi:hypothetical protein
LIGLAWESRHAVTEKPPTCISEIIGFLLKALKSMIGRLDGTRLFEASVVSRISFG